jgi:response regulator RpfG family c-di-GMP phosphodiesterase
MTMIASGDFGAGHRRRVADLTLARVPQRSFGDTSWVTLALQSCALHLTPAIRSGNAHRIASAVRAIAHAPTPEQVDDIVGAACDTMLSEGYADRDSRLISNVVGARGVIAEVVAEVRERSERDAHAPALLRETVETYVRIVGLLDQRIAQRLEAVGKLSARIGSAMHLPAPALFDLELAGRLYDVGALATGAVDERPVAGEAFLKSVPSLAYLAPIVRSQHERFDGTGRPDGLAREEIPLASRIICVAAAFVDLVTDTGSREAVLPATACRKLAAAAGTQFDPNVVAAIHHLLRFRHRTNRSA